MTRTAIATLLVVALVSSPLMAQQPANEADAWRALVASLEPAAMVRLRLKDGSRIQGTILQHTDVALMLKPRTRIPVPARTIAFADIETLERKNVGMSPGAKVALGIGVGGGSVALAILLLLLSVDD